MGENNRLSTAHHAHFLPCEADFAALSIFSYQFRADAIYRKG